MATSDERACAHVWRFQGLVWKYGTIIPGSGAHNIEYSDRYYCERCLAKRDLNPRTQGNSYQNRIEGSMPA